MPEGPECKIMSEKMDAFFGGKSIDGIDFISGRYSDGSKPNGYDRFISSAPLTVRSISCKGKFIYFLLREEGSSLASWSIWSTLGTSGWWSKDMRNVSRMAVSLSSGERAYFNDNKNFGTIKFEKGLCSLKSKLSAIGHDILSCPPTANEFFNMLKNQNPDKNICKFLLDQKYVSGIGNYIKSESLYFSRISPHRTCDSLSLFEAVSLRTALVRISRDSYDNGGASIKNHLNFDSSAGSYHNKLSVYSKVLDPFGRKIRKEKTPDKRITYWVEGVQR